MAKAKTLVIQPLQGIGDYMWFVPHLHALANTTPEKKISLLTRPRSFADQLSAEDPMIDDVIWLEIKKGQHDGLCGLWRLAQVLRKKKYTKAYILHSRSLRYPLLCRMAGIPKIYGPGMGWQKVLLHGANTFLRKEDQKKHPIQRATQVIKNHGLSLEESSGLHLGWAEKEAEEFLASMKPPYFALCIGSSEAQKKWPMEYYIQLAEMIAHRKKGTILILGGPSEVVEGKNIEMALNHKKNPGFFFVSGDLRFTLGVLKKVAFIVGNDTG
ncbi:MAG: glycosyltransferase family 9 protein [Holosporaceae bacterium]|nr:MAG: glycosyltransferase family 9 protein [Holosporaceae bacterium]